MSDQYKPLIPKEQAVRMMIMLLTRKEDRARAENETPVLVRGKIQLLDQGVLERFVSEKEAKMFDKWKRIFTKTDARLTPSLYSMHPVLTNLPILSSTAVMKDQMGQPKSIFQATATIPRAGFEEVRLTSMASILFENGAPATMTTLLFLPYPDKGDAREINKQTINPSIFWGGQYYWAMQGMEPGTYVGCADLRRNESPSLY